GRGTGRLPAPRRRPVEGLRRQAGRRCRRPAHAAGCRLVTPPRRVLVVTKAPRPGEVKTRLCPPLGLGLAARLAAAFTADVLKAAREADPAAGLIAPAADVGELRRAFPGVEVIGQDGDGLAAA